jgi:hypothetical protein
MSFLNLGRPRWLPIIAAVTALCVLAMVATASAIVRPKGASVIQATLDIAYNECTTVGGDPAGQTHNPDNLPGDACTAAGTMTPMKATSPLLTAGEPPVTPAQFEGQVKIQVCSDATGIAVTCAGNGGISTGSAGADVIFKSGYPQHNYLRDVRCNGANLVPTSNPWCLGTAGSPAINTAGNVDYATTSMAAPALLAAKALIRITDVNTGSGGTYTTEGTTKDLDFEVPIICSLTAASIGGSCVPAKSSANNILTPACGSGTPPCVVATGKRSNIETGQISVTDAGDTPVDGNPFSGTGNKDYARQGVFIP